MRITNYCRLKFRVVITRKDMVRLFNAAIVKLDVAEAN